jgi:hypothetical protein
MTARWITAALLLVASPGLAQEQEPVLEVGDRVRVTAPDVSRFPLVGIYAGLQYQNEAVELLIDETRSKVPLAQIEKIELSTGKGSRAWLGAGVGFFVFGIGGGLAAEALCTWGPGPTAPLVGENHESTRSCSTAEAAGVGVLTGLVGAGLGALVGSAFKSDKWEPLELPARPIVAVHSTGRFHVGISIPLRR